MVRIVTVCGMGLGSGLMARMTVERVLKRNGVLILSIVSRYRPKFR